LTTVVGPVNSGGAFSTGILVAPENAINAMPFTKVTLAPATVRRGVGADFAGAANVVGTVTTMNGVPSIVVVAPTRPSGAAPAAIVVGAGMTTIGPGCGEVAGQVLYAGCD
jgi:hypothetical protein